MSSKSTKQLKASNEQVSKLELLLGRKVEELNLNAEEANNLISTLEAGVKLAQPKKKGRGIEERCCELLFEVAYTDANGMTYGRPYGSIVEQIREEFPGAKTSDNCASWYKSMIANNRKGYGDKYLPLYGKLPQRRLPD